MKWTWDMETASAVANVAKLTEAVSAQRGTLAGATADIKDYSKAAAGVYGGAAPRATSAVPPAPRAAPTPRPAAAPKASPEEKVQVKSAEEKAAEKAEKDKLSASKRYSAGLVAAMNRNTAYAERQAKQLAALDEKSAKTKDRQLAKGAEGAVSWAKKGAAAAAGAAGMSSAWGAAKGLASIAMGYRGMGQLNRLAFQAQYNFRRLFVGVDPAPVVRAFDKLTQAFNPKSFMGAELGKILTRSFNGVFALVEKAQPYVTAFGQWFVYAFLLAENAVLRARIALVPYEPLLGGIVGKTGLMRTAAIGGGLALGILAVYAAAAAAPFVLLAAAITSVASALEQLSKLQKEWDENSAGQIWRKLKSDVGSGPAGGSDKDRGVVTGADYDRMQAARASAAGRKTGEALADGVVAGMASKESAVAAGGAALAKAADTGAKTEGKIRSPSRKMRDEVGAQLGAGVEMGLRASAPGVQQAAGEAFVPRAPSAPRGASAAPGGGRREVHVHIHTHGPVYGSRSALEALIRDVVIDQSEEIVTALGGAAA